MQLFRRKNQSEKSGASTAPKTIGRGRRVFHIVLGFAIALVALAPINIAFGFFRLGVRNWSGHPYSLCADAFARSGDWLLVALLILLPAVYYALRPRSSALWLVLSFVVAFGTLEQIPEHVLPQTMVSEAQENLREKAFNLATALENPAEKGSLLPASQTQLAGVAAMAAQQDGLDLRGPYFQDGTPVAAHLVYLGGAAGPLVIMPAHPPLPAAVYCAVSQDRKHFWITATMLDRSVGGHPRWVEARDGAGRPLIVSSSPASQP